jgi:hypothetical protein
MYMLVNKLCIKVLEEVHDVPMAGHRGENTTQAELSKSFY